MIHGHEGSTQLLTLKFDGEAGSRLAIIRDMQFDPVTERLLHVDLQEVSADRAITVRVAVHPVGEAVGVKDTKGILNLVLHEVEVSCLPTAIPERIDADVTALRIGDVLTVADLPCPEGVRILNDPGQAVATVWRRRWPRKRRPPAAAAAVTAEPEVLTERKPKEEGGRSGPSGRRREGGRRSSGRRPAWPRWRGRARESGPEYRDTRHNVGQRVLDVSPRTLPRAWRRDGGGACRSGRWRGDTVA